MSKEKIKLIKGIALGFILAAIMEYTLQPGITNMTLFCLSLGINIYIIGKILPDDKRWTKSK